MLKCWQNCWWGLRLFWLLFIEDLGSCWYGRKIYHKHFYTRTLKNNLLIKIATFHITIKKKPLLSIFQHQQSDCSTLVKNTSKRLQKTNTTTEYLHCFLLISLKNIVKVFSLKTSRNFSFALSNRFEIFLFAFGWKKNREKKIVEKQWGEKSVFFFCRSINKKLLFARPVSNEIIKRSMISTRCMFL